MKKVVLAALLASSILACGSNERDRRERRRRSVEDEEETAAAVTATVTTSARAELVESARPSASASGLTSAQIAEQRQIEDDLLRQMMGDALSCEDAQRLLTTRTDPMSAPSAQLTERLNKGSYLNACGVPSSTEVQICAVYDGKGPPTGVTIKVTPADAKLAACIDAQVRTIQAADPLRAVVRTTFAPSR